MNKSVKRLVFSAIMVALGAILMFLEFPILPVAPWLAIDFSFIPILIVALAYGKADAFLVTLAISVIHFLLKGDLTGLPIGQLANIIAVMSFLVVFVYFKKKEKTIIGGVAGVLFVTLILVVANYFVITPWYFDILGMDLTETAAAAGYDSFLAYAVGVIGLFNLIKWTIISTVTLIINKTIDKFVEEVK
ncbi:MAG: ECF transporter S component [Erysipelotrichaceae bacterium]